MLGCGLPCRIQALFFGGRILALVAKGAETGLEMGNKSTKNEARGRRVRPAQTQRVQPGRETRMRPPPVSAQPTYLGSGKLLRRVALITGGDSGIGRAVACAFAREGADVAVHYRNEDADARETRELVRREGRKCLLIKGDLKRLSTCQRAIRRVQSQFGRLDVLVNNAAVQFPIPTIDDLQPDRLEETFAVNVFAMFYLVQHALPLLRKQAGSTIINTTSVTAYRGSPELLDYSASKGAIVSLTRSLARALLPDQIRVNAVAPGPIWTPLIPATFPGSKVATFGSDSPMGRTGQPFECAPCFVFLASSDSSFMTGQVLHPNGGEIVNG